MKTPEDDIQRRMNADTNNGTLEVRPDSTAFGDDGKQSVEMINKIDANNRKMKLEKGTTLWIKVPNKCGHGDFFIICDRHGNINVMNVDGRQWRYIKK